MSYMNDDCDPFGVPYSTNNGSGVKKTKTYSFKELENLRKREWDVNHELHKIREDKEKAMEQLKKKLKTYLEPYAKIECDKNMNWEIIVNKFDLSKLEQLKKDFNLKDIRVECCKIKILEKYENRIKIKLFV